MINKTAVVISSGFEKSGIGKYSQNLFSLINKEFKQTVKVFLNSSESRVEIYKGEKVEYIFLNKISFLSAYFFQWRCRNLLGGLGDIYFITNEKNSVINVKPKIVTCHDLIIFKYPRKIWEIFIRNYMYSYVKRTDLILCDSESTRNDLVNILKVNTNKTTLLYPTISESYSRKDKEECNFLIKKYNLSNCKKILFVGSEEPRKNIPVLLEIFKGILDKIKDVQLIKIGSASSLGSRKETLRLIRKLGLEGKVKILEGIPEKEMPYFYSLADIFVFPSKYEGFGYPIVEAMSCGCPVVTSDNSSLPEIVGDAGFKLNCMDVNGFIKKSLEILGDENLAKKMGENGLKQTEKFKMQELPQAIISQIMENIEYPNCPTEKFNVIVLTGSERTKHEIESPLLETKLLSETFYFKSLIRESISPVKFLRKIIKLNKSIHSTRSIFLVNHISPYCSFLVVCLSKYFKCPIVMRVRGRHNEEYTRTLKEFKKERKFFELLSGKYQAFIFNKILVPNITHFILMSKWCIPMMKDNSSFSLLENCIDTQEFKKDNLGDGDYILAVTDFQYKEKIQALDLFLTEYSDFIIKNKLKFKIAGSGFLLNNFKNKHTNLNCVEYLGNVKNVKNLYHNARLFIHFSFFDAYPTVILEAMVSKVPILATNCCGMKEQIIDGEEGFLIDLRNKKETERKLSLLLTSNELRVMFVENAYKKVTQRNNFRRIGKKMESTLNEVYEKFILLNNLT